VETGKNWPAYVGDVGARFGLCQPVWREFRPGLRMRLDIRDMIQQTILLEDKCDPPLTTLSAKTCAAATSSWMSERITATSL